MILNYVVVILLWLLMMVASWPYVRRHHNPDQHPLAAYMIFVTVFGAASFFIFALASRIATLIWPGLLTGVGPMLLLAVLAVVPAFYLARWQIRKPPIERPPPS